MPTFKRKPWALLPPPDKADVEKEPEREVWLCRITGEVFDNYEAYFHRFNLYRQHTWMCSSTGKTQLTYEEALLSERKARRLIEEGLPDIWKKALLLKANFSTERLDHVVDFVHDALRQHAFVDEDVNIEITQWTSHMARVVQPPDTTDARFAEPTLKAGEVRIRWLNQFGEPEGEAEVIPTKRIKRDRIAFSKQNFKRFLKENMTRELWAGSPLVIKPEVAARLGIPTDMPPGIQDLYRKRIEGPDYRPPRTLHAEPEFPTRFPVDDTQLHRLVREDPQFLAKHGDLPWSSGAAPAIADEQRTLGKRPEGKKVPSERVPLPQGVVADVLFVWNFLTVYCKPLNLYPFTFDDFVNALTTLDYRNEVMSETVFSLLRVSRRERENLVKAAEKAKAAALAAEKAAAALRDLDRGAGEDGTDAGDGSGTPPAEVGTPSAAGSAAPSGVKPALKIDTSTKKEPVDDGSDKDSSSPLTPIDEHALVNLEIDRHLTWVRSWTNFPWSAWSTHPSARGLPAHPCVRLKGWQAALMSAVVDLVWLLPGAKDPEVFIPGYWRIIGKMLELADREEEDEGVDTLLKLDPPPKQDPVLAQLPPEPIQPQQADAASASAADEADMSIFDDVDAEGVPASEESDAEYGPTGRKLRKGKRPAPTAVPAAAMDEPFHDPTKRRRLGAGMYDESRAAVMPGVASLVAVTLAAEKPQQLSTRKTTKKTMPDLEFLHICERGWNRLKIREKLGLLKFLIEEIVFGWEEIRRYQEQAHDEVVNLRKIRFELAQERQDLMNEKEEMEERLQAEEEQDPVPMEAAPASTPAPESAPASEPAAPPAPDPMDQDTEDDLDGTDSNASTSRRRPAKAKAGSSSAAGGVSSDEDEEISFEDSDSSDSDSSDTDSDGGGSSAAAVPAIPSARQTDLAAAQAQRKADERARKQQRAAIAKSQKERAKTLKARADERKRMEEKEKHLQRRETLVERQIRGWSAVSHGRPIGRDRWFNRYWNFDSWFGGGVADMVQTDGAVKGKKDASTDGGPLQRWASGKLWIEVVGPEDIRDPTWQRISDNPRMLDAPSKEWTFIETEGDVDELMRWLNPRGEREFALSTLLADCMDDFKAGIRRREEDLTNQYISKEKRAAARGGTGTLPAHGYVNKWAGGFPKNPSH